MLEHDEKAKVIIREFARMQSDRTTYETAWRDLRYYVRPNAVDFSGSSSPGDERTQRMYDGTAMLANCDLAGELHADLFNPAQRSFGIEVEGTSELNRDGDVIAWCEVVADAIFAEYSDDRSMFTGSGHEALLDIGAFGNAVVLQEWDTDERHLIFQTFPLAHCYWELNKNGIPDKLARMENATLRQIYQRFPDVDWEGIKDESQDRKYTLIHMVQPRSDRDRAYPREDGPNMPFSSCWVLKEKGIVLKEGGYISFPYHCPRWSKTSDETYGRGPAINCLAEIRMLQRQQWTVIRAAEKAVDPPLIMPSDGFLMPYKTGAGSINYIDPSYASDEIVRSLEHRGNFPVTFEMMEQERLFIKKCFYTDWMDEIPKVERQTAREIDVLTERKLNKMAPLLGRLQTELMVPMIQRSFELLTKAGYIPPAPELLQGQTLKVSYVSASARAQAAGEVSAMILYGQQLVPIAGIQPDVIDAIDFDAFAQELAIKQRISSRIRRTPEAIAAIRAAREEQEQAQALAGAAEPVSKAVLNLAQAGQAGGIAA